MWFLSYFLVHLVVYTLIRLEFLVWNWSSLSGLSGTELLRAFLHGLRFDLSALAVTLGICFLGLLWMAKNNLFRRIWLHFFIVLNAFFYVVNIVDIELYNFTAKRFTTNAFYLIREGGFNNLIIPYIPLVVVSMLLVGTYLYVAYRLIRGFKNQLSQLQKTIVTPCLLLVAVILSRGGFQHKPLTFVDAKLFDNTFANNLILNSTFTVLKSATKKSIERVRYFESEELLTYLNPPVSRKVMTPEKKINIVLIALESFSKEFVDLQNPEATPFFNSLRRQGVYFAKSYANGRRSIEGMAAILSGIPALMEEPFISSEFSANQIIGLGSLLAAEGYESGFFHATNVGSMHFDGFVKSVGIKHHYSVEDYPNSQDHDGTWGIFDEPFLRWTCEKLTNTPPPFFSVIFTLSSHQPYRLPEEYVEKFKDDRLPILKSIRYADYSLEKFFDCARTQPWFENTLFVLTADHTGPELKPNSNFLSRFEVPILLYGPSLAWLKNIDSNQFAQQIDIPPTILDILNIEQKNMNFLSRSLLRSGSPKVIGLYSDGRYELVGDVKNNENQLKAIRQYFSEGLYDNRLYYPTKSN